MTAFPLKPDRRAVHARRWLDASTAGVTLFLAVNVVLQFLPPYYDPISQAVSDLAIGPFGWVMGAALVLSGLSILAFVAGAWAATTPETRSRIGLVLVTVWGLATLAIGFFPTDIVDSVGYPGAAQAWALSTSTHGRIHIVIASVLFPSMVLGLIVCTVGLRREARLRALYVASVVLAAAALLGLLLLEPLGIRGFYGVVERAVSLLGFVWIAMVARRLRQTAAPVPDCLADA